MKVVIPKGTTFFDGKLTLIDDTAFEAIGATQAEVAGELACRGEIYGAVASQLTHEREIDGKKFKVTYGAQGVENISEIVVEKAVKPKK